MLILNWSDQLKAIIFDLRYQLSFIFWYKAYYTKMMHY